jgi:hypothetical protein
MTIAPAALKKFNFTELSVNGSYVNVKYSKSLNGILPSFSRFRVTVNGVRRRITGPAILSDGGTTIRLNLATPVLATDTVTITCTSVNGLDRTGFGDVRSLRTNQKAAFFINQRATNLTPPATQPGPDQVLSWTNYALDLILSSGSNGKSGVPPTTGSRLMAMLYTAMLDTRAAFGDQVAFYRVDRNAHVNANLNAALIGAAYRVLSLELPGESELLQKHYNDSLTSLKGSPQDIKAGLTFGSDIADQIRSLRASDGSTNNTPYTPPSNGLPGYTWMPATTGPTAGVALGPNWGAVKPWGVVNTATHRTDGLQARPDVNLDLYAQELNEVRLYGGLSDTETTTSLRNPNQTEIALFWAYDRPDTFRPYGQLFDIAAEISVSQKTTPVNNAILFSNLSIAMADAVTLAWKEKYDNVQPRPWDVITGSFSDTDGSALTVRDSQWKSLLSSINGVQSPPFPDFLSGHSVMSGIFASVMSHFYGDNITFSTTSQELPGVTRTFDGFIEKGSLGNIDTIINSKTYRPNSFYEAGIEGAVSRVYGGVHVREACLDSFNLGVKVGYATVSGKFL